MTLGEMITNIVIASIVSKIISVINKTDNLNRLPRNAIPTLLQESSSIDCKTKCLS